MAQAAKPWPGGKLPSGSHSLASIRTALLESSSTSILTIVMQNQEAALDKRSWLGGLIPTLCHLEFAPVLSPPFWFPRVC